MTPWVWWQGVNSLVHVLSWHQVQQEAQLGEALKQVQEAGIIPEEQVRLCVVCDGAEWIGKHVQSLFPHARQGLDYSHCAQYLHRVAKAHYGVSVQALEWVEATMTRLSLGKAGLVLGGLKRMQAQSDEAEKAIANCWDYLYEHWGRTAYHREPSPSRARASAAGPAGWGCVTGSWGCSGGADANVMSAACRAWGSPC